MCREVNCSPTCEKKACSSHTKQRNASLIQILCCPHSPNFLISPQQKHNLQRPQARKYSDRGRWLSKTNWLRVRKGDLKQNIYSLRYARISSPWDFAEPGARETCGLVDFGGLDLLNDRRNWSLRWRWSPCHLPEYSKRKTSFPQRFR